MIFTETKLKGAFVIEPEKLEDERGFFARTFCRKEFEGHGLNPNLVQCNISFNKRESTIRGMHYQVKPYGETKLVSCVGGAIYDIIIDLRPNSPTYCQWLAVELTSENFKLLYVPEGFAHGFLVLSEVADVVYKVTSEYSPQAERGIIWNDPQLAIEWSIEEPLLSIQDTRHPTLKEADNNFE